MGPSPDPTQCRLNLRYKLPAARCTAPDYFYLFIFFDALNFIEPTFASVAKPRGVKTLPTTHAKGS